MELRLGRIEFVFRPIERWPQEPTPAPKPAHFRSTYTQTLKDLEYELARLGVSRAYIQVDVTESEIRNDGHIRADARPRSQRVIVSAETKHGPISLPCDTFKSWQDNLRAIALSLDALRAVDRYGVTKRGEQYRGLKQLAAGDGPLNSREAAAFIAKHCHRGNPDLAESCERDMLLSVRNFERCYHAAARNLHPDTAGDGSRGEWDNLQRAIVILRDHHSAHRGQA